MGLIDWGGVQAFLQMLELQVTGTSTSSDLVEIFTGPAIYFNQLKCCK